MHARPLTSCPTQSNPVDSSLPGSSVHGILQARIPEWEAMPSSRYLSHPGIKLAPLLSPALADRFFTISTIRGSQTKASIHQFSFPSDSFKLREFDYVYIKWNYFVTKKRGGGGASLVVQTVKHLPANAGDPGWIPGSGRHLGEGNSNPFQYSCLENFSMDGGTCKVVVHGFAKNRTQLILWHFHFHIKYYKNFDRMYIRSTFQDYSKKSIRQAILTFHRSKNSSTKWALIMI